MVPLRQLWIPVLLSAALVFVASSVSHALVRFHRSDFGKLSVEPELLELLRKGAVGPGDYLFPRPSGPEEVRDPAFREKFRRGPAGLATILPPGGLPMGRTYLLWLLYAAAASALAAIVAGGAFPPGASAAAVFRTVAVVGFAAYGVAVWQDSIWYGRSFATSLRFTVDAVAYALLTGGAFAGLWPR
jgi:hypothetical protein